jgi:predicted GH43/DUF377 family glycosyl hydrolase
MKMKLLIKIVVASMIMPMAVNQLLLEPEAISRQYGVDLAFNRRVVSTGSTDGNLNIHAVDANRETRYAADGIDEAYFYVDLGSVEKVGKVIIDWEAAYAKEYILQMSLDAIAWIDVAHVNKTESSVDEIEFPVWLETQFVKFQGVERAEVGGVKYGYSFYSFEVYGPRNLAAFANVKSVSSFEAEDIHKKDHMTDNLAHTRWASSVADNQYVLFDLLQVQSFETIKIRWEVSFARIFDIYAHPETSSTAPTIDDESWYKIAGSDVGLGEVDTLKTLDLVDSRYIKLDLIQRETSEQTKKTGRFPWESTFSLYSFEIYDWNSIFAAPLGHVMEFSKNSPAWVAMNNITLYDGGLILAPIDYPIDAIGHVTDLASMADGNIPGFESYAVYNPAVIYDYDREMFHMIYRSELPDCFHSYFCPIEEKYEQGHMSTLSYAYSYDGYSYVRGDDNPIAWPTDMEENGGGLEDPRMFRIENDPHRGGLTTYYITYTMYNNDKTRQGIIYTHDFVTYHKEGRLLPNYDGSTKSGSYVTDPEGNAVKISDPRPGKTGEVYIIYIKDGGYTKIGFTNDVLTIANNDLIDLASGVFGSNDIEDLTHGNESCMAITNIYGPDDEDIYLMYGGTWLSDPLIRFQQPNVNDWFYALGALKTTKSNPFELTNMQLDLDEPTIYPTDTNKIDYGLFDKCMFADTMVRVDNTWFFYYGAGDMYVGLATARGDFGAGAASYSIDESLVKASTMALNKRYENDKSDYSIEFVIELYDINGELLDDNRELYSVPHFSHLELGKYSRGIDIEVMFDLSNVSDLPDDYYLVSYVIDAVSKEKINHPSSYLVVNPQISHYSR